MDKSPTTDKHLDITLTSDIKFRDIRNKSKKEEKERSRPKRKKKKKEKEESIPKFNIDDTVIVCSGMFDSKRRYGMVKIVDIQKSPRRDTFEYFGVLLKTTDPDYIDRLGGLICFDQGDQFRWSWMYETTSIPPDTDSIKWLNKKEEYKPKSEFERVGELAHDGVQLVNLLERVYREHPQLQNDLFSKIFKDCRVFILNSEQVTKLNEWFLGLKKRYEGAIGGGLSYTFIPTGLGVIVKVKYFDEELDLSDYESW